ncbi:MAG: hypothetical protein VX777_01200 [Chlamydiota bacterium]|nr:hypothetical protein [Chlamydiota bacterium]
MKVFSNLQLFTLFTCIQVLTNNLYSHTFVKTQTELETYFNQTNSVMIASIGRSGSTLLSNALEQSLINCRVLKSHLLPPKNSFKGKIIFIYSNPDISAESAFHVSLNSSQWGYRHFSNVESSDIQWLSAIKKTSQQDLYNNLLCYDALGYNKQLTYWLYEKVEPCAIENAQILAVKFENLWDEETIAAVESFLFVDELSLPPKKERGYKVEDLSEKEASIRNYYNQGTANNSKYEAYDEARELWKIAPPYQFLKLRN